MLNVGFTWAGKSPEYIVLICAVQKTGQPGDVTTCEGEGQRSIAFQDNKKTKGRRDENRIKNEGNPRTDSKNPLKLTNKSRYVKSDSISSYPFPRSMTSLMGSFYRIKDTYFSPKPDLEGAVL